MKRIGILSDTHGYLEDINLVLAATADQDIDMWLHAGDFGDDARYMQEHTDIPVYAVRGNNDRVQPLEPREQLIPLEDTYIYMTHGHEVSYYNRIQKPVYYTHLDVYKRQVVVHRVLDLLRQSFYSKKVGA